MLQGPGRCLSLMRKSNSKIGSIEMKKQLNATWIIIGILLAQIVFMADFYFNHMFSSGMFESDAASDLVLSHIIFDEGKLIYSDNWWYSTESGLLNVVPFLGLIYHVTGDYQLSYGFTRVIMAAIISVCVILVMKAAKSSLNNILFAVILILIPYGSYRRYSVFSVLTGIGYYTYFAIFPFLYLAIWLYLRRDKDDKKRIILWIIQFLIALICGIASIRFSFILVLPVIGTEVIDIWLSYLGDKSRKTDSVSIKNRVINILVMLSGYMIGFIYHAKVLAVKYPSRDFSGLGFAGIDQIRNQFWLIIEGIIKSFGYAADGGSIFCFIGIFHLVCLAYLIVVICMVVDLLKNAKGNVWYITFFFTLQFGIGVFIQLVTMAYDIGAVQRYVWESMFGCILIPTLYLVYLEEKKNESDTVTAEEEETTSIIKKTIPVFKAIAVLSLIGVLLANDLTLYLSYNPDRGQITKYNREVVMGNYRNSTVAQRQGYISFLKENGLTLGYADFWDAAITTVLTNDEVTVCGANEDEYFTYKRWSNRKDYEDAEKYPPQFYLYTIGMEQKRLDNGWSVGSKEIYRDDYYVVYEP